MSAETAVSQNRLAAETSPYLLQHAGNPVHWQPWDKHALAAARELDKPILLSIGYSACHWCHVMAHESFEHAETADLMNELFINIKVDREERPDLDRVYQAAHQMLAQRAGGWPLTVILTPGDLTPFFAGTYFPREPRFGVPAFRDMLTKIHAAWRDKPGQIHEQNKQLLNVFRQLDDDAIGKNIRLTDTPLLQSRRQLEAVFDPDNGGFQGSPKFPQAPNLAMLFQHGVSESDRPAERLALFTLQRMAERGLYDHLGGGFFRYCVDTEWEIPHYEKMLYDNGLLLTLYARGWNISKEERFRDVLTRTADWAMNEMQSPAGGYFSSLDADSDGVEGAFYTWTREEVREALGGHPDAERLLHVANRYFGFDAEPNFGDRWHINIGDLPETIAAADGIALESVREMIDFVSARLLEHRELRIHPQRDEKILTSWNALMIKGMTAAAKALKQDEWYRSASQAMDFIMNECWDEQQLYACWKDEQARFPAYLDDHAFLIDALTELLSYEWRNDYLNFAVSLADRMLDDFEDRKNGGFFFTTAQHDNPVKRMRIFNDDATPSGNGIGARGLLRLGRLLGETRYLDAAERTLRAGWTPMSQSPYGHAGMLLALREYLADPPTVIIRGDMHIARIWLERLRNDIPTMSQIFALPEQDHALPETLRDKKLQGNCVAYVCRGFACSEPITDRDRLHDALTNAI